MRVQSHTLSHNNMTYVVETWKSKDGAMIELSNVCIYCDVRNRYTVGPHNIRGCQSEFSLCDCVDHKRTRSLMLSAFMALCMDLENRKTMLTQHYKDLEECFSNGRS